MTDDNDKNEKGESELFNRRQFLQLGAAGGLKALLPGAIPLSGPAIISDDITPSLSALFVNLNQQGIAHEYVIENKRAGVDIASCHFRTAACFVDDNNLLTERLLKHHNLTPKARDVVKRVRNLCFTVQKHMQAETAGGNSALQAVSAQRNFGRILPRLMEELDLEMRALPGFEKLSDYILSQPYEYFEGSLDLVLNKVDRLIKMPGLSSASSNANSRKDNPKDDNKNQTESEK